MRVFKTKTRVRYAETDATGIAYYNSYFVYFELGRIEMFRELGLTYDRHLPIVDTRCLYRASAEFDDLLEIHTFVEEIRAKGFRLGCEVYKIEEGSQAVLLVEGYTAMVTVDDDGNPVPIPKTYRLAFEDE